MRLAPNDDPCSTPGSTSALRHAWGNGRAIEGTFHAAVNPSADTVRSEGRNAPVNEGPGHADVIRTVVSSPSGRNESEPPPVRARSKEKGIRSPGRRSARPPIGASMLPANMPITGRPLRNPTVDRPQARSTRSFRPRWSGSSTERMASAQRTSAPATRHAAKSGTVYEPETCSIVS